MQEHHPEGRNMEMYSLFLAVPRKREVHRRSKTDRVMSNSSLRTCL